MLRIPRSMNIHMLASLAQADHLGLSPTPWENVLTEGINNVMCYDWVPTGADRDSLLIPAPVNFCHFGQDFGWDYTSKIPKKIPKFSVAAGWTTWNFWSKIVFSQLNFSKFSPAAGSTPIDWSLKTQENSKICEKFQPKFHISKVRVPIPAPVPAKFPERPNSQNGQIPAKFGSSRPRSWPNSHPGWLLQCNHCFFLLQHSGAMIESQVSM